MKPEALPFTYHPFQPLERADPSVWAHAEEWVHAAVRAIAVNGSRGNPTMAQVARLMAARLYDAGVRLPEEDPRCLATAEAVIVALGQDPTSRTVVLPNLDGRGMCVHVAPNPAEARRMRAAFPAVVEAMFRDREAEWQGA